MAKLEDKKMIFEFFSHVIMGAEEASTSQPNGRAAQYKNVRAHSRFASLALSLGPRHVHLYSRAG